MQWARALYKKALPLSFAFVIFAASISIAMQNMEHLTVENSISDLLAHPGLQDFASHMLPRAEDAKSSLRLKDIGRLMPWHSHIRPREIVDSLNRLVDDVARGLPVFYSFSSQASLREQTGLFFFRGNPAAPFALICPGGGFRYVGSLHEGFPLAQYLSKQGYNAFVLQYRIGGEKVACEDMAQALSWIFSHASELDISTSDYSVWGGSAGARMAADLGSYGSLALGGEDLPGPCAVIMAYTGHNWLTKGDPPTFSVVSEDDPIASARVMKERTDALKANGIPAEILIVKRSGHGFGLGTGTDADGWAAQALKFWQKHMQG